MPESDHVLIKDVDGNALGWVHPSGHEWVAITSNGAHLTVHITKAGAVAYLKGQS